MSVSLTNVNRKININYLTGNGIMTCSDGAITKTESINEDSLSNALQTKLSIIDQIQSESISNFAKQWYATSNSPTTAIFDIVCSGDGKYVLICFNGTNPNVSLSNDYGSTWTIPPITSSIQCGAMNLNGQYIVISHELTYKISTDFGKTFIKPDIRPLYVESLAISATGKYIVAASTANEGLSVSSDYGKTWIKRENSFYAWFCVAMAIDGSVIYGCTDAGVIKKTVNYGDTWEICGKNTFWYIKHICCSGDGKYVLAITGGTLQLLLSSDYGYSFNFVGNADNYKKAVMSKNGMYMVATVHESKIIYSEDYGTTWSTFTNSEFSIMTMSYNGEHMYNVNNYSNVIISRNNNNNVIRTIRPSVPTTGSQYIDISTNKLFIYTGSSWKSVTLS